MQILRDIYFSAVYFRINCSFLSTISIVRMSEHSDHMDSLTRLICDSFGFSEEVLERIKSCGLDEESLGLITDEDVNELFPITMLGIRVKFKARLSHWRQNEADTISVSSCCSKWLSKISTQTSQDSAVLSEMLAGCQKGNFVINFFKENGYLNDDQRIALISIITDYYKDRNICMTMKDIIRMSQEIITIFPNEHMNYYYCNRGKGRNPTGKLHDRAVNDRLKIKKNVSCASGTSIPVILKNMETIPDIDVHEDENENQIWLQHNCDPWDEVMQKWTTTFKKRQRDIRNAEKNVLVNWPLFKNALGFTLIETDFEILFPEKGNNLLKNWAEFKIKIIPYLKQKIKDPGLKKLISELDNDLSLDSEDYIVVLLLHAVVKPPILNVKCRESAKRRMWKPTVCDAQECTVLYCTSLNDYERKYTKLKEKQLGRGLTLQPLIVVIGESITALKNFYVTYDAIFYKLPTFLKSLDTTFKLYHVMNFEYQKEATNFFTFFECFFYKISKSTNSNILAITSYLEQNCKD